MSESPPSEVRNERRVRAAAKAFAEEALEGIDRDITILELERADRLAEKKLRSEHPAFLPFRRDKSLDQRHRVSTSEATPQQKLQALTTKTEPREVQWFDAREDAATKEEVKAFNALEKAVLEQTVDAKVSDLLSRASSRVTKHSLSVKPTVTANVAGRPLTRAPTRPSEHSVNASHVAGASKSDYPTLLSKARANRAERAETFQSETEPASKEGKATTAGGENPSTLGVRHAPRVSVGGMAPLVYTHGPEAARRREKRWEASTARHNAKAEAESAAKQKLQDAGTASAESTPRTTARVEQPTRTPVSNIRSGRSSLPHFADLNTSRDSNGTGNVTKPSNAKDIAATTLNDTKPIAESSTSIKSIKDTTAHVKQPARVSVSGQAPGYDRPLRRFGETVTKSFTPIKGDDTMNTGPSTNGTLTDSKKGASITMPEQPLTDITTAVSGITIGSRKLIVSSPRATKHVNIDTDHQSITITAPRKREVPDSPRGTKDIGEKSGLTIEADFDNHDFALVHKDVPSATNGSCLPNADMVIDQLNEDFSPYLKEHSGWDDGDETDDDEDWDQGGLAEWKWVGEKAAKAK